MTGLDLCPKCKGLHYKTAPCIVRNRPAEKIIEGPQKALAVAKGDAKPYAVHRPDRNKSRHRPGYFTEYMREYRARKASKSNPNTPERNDE